MQTVDGPVTGPIIVRRDTRMFGVVTGDVTVPAGVRLELSGTVTGNLMACRDSSVVISGRVAGRLFNEGGVVSIFGEVGMVQEDRPGITYVAPDAVICQPARRRAG